MCRMEDLGELPGEARETLLSVEAPIVIVPWHDHHLSKLINPLDDNIGVMLPYTPLHRLLLSYTHTKYLVATSGNRQAGYALISMVAFLVLTYMLTRKL